MRPARNPGAGRRAQRGGAAAAPKRPGARAERLAGLLVELENAVASVGIRVRRERLMREVGYHARSGLCRVEGEEILFLDPDLAPDDELELLVSTLSGRDLDAAELSPATRRLLLETRSEAMVDKPDPRP